MTEPVLLRPGSDDAYGEELWACYKSGDAYELVERDDGLVSVGSAVRYFAEYKDWPQCEQKAAHLARGRVLDIGCGLSTADCSALAVPKRRATPVRKKRLRSSALFVHCRRSSPVRIGRSAV